MWQRRQPGISRICKKDYKKNQKIVKFLQCSSTIVQTTYFGER